MLPRLNRLITAQGSSQLLTVISILKSQKTNHEYGECNDFLLLGGFATTNSKSNKAIIQVCQEIAEIWEFQKILILPDIPDHFNFSQMILKRGIRKAIGLKSDINVTYTSRDWQCFNECILSAYPHAHKIFYGDSQGLLDIVGNYNLQSLTTSDKIATAYLIIPISEHRETFSKCDVQIADIHHYVSTIHQAANRIEGLSNYCQKNLKNSKKPITILILANLTEARITSSLEDEVKFYLACVLPHTDENDIIWVKSHPRQKFNQSKILVTKLREYGREALEIVDFGCVPIELFTPFLKSLNIVTCLSSSCLSLAYLGNYNIIFGASNEDVKKYLVPDERMHGMLLFQSISSLVLQYMSSSSIKKMKLFSGDDVNNSNNFSEFPLKIKSSFWDNFFLDKIDCEGREEIVGEMNQETQYLPSHFSYKLLNNCVSLRVKIMSFLKNIKRVFSKVSEAVKKPQSV
jgi:hypothetical protein